jgi:hypothetical protein
MGEELKQIWKKGTYHNVAFWICLGVSISMMLVSFFVPPLAVIDSSIFVATSILFAYAALASFNTALEKGVDAKVKHGETELQIINDDDKNKNKELSEEYDT